MPEGVVSSDLDLRHPDWEIIGVHWSPRGLDIERDLTYEEVESISVVLSRIFEATRFALADALAHSERRWGEAKYSQLAAVTGRSEGSLMTMAWIARCVPREIRRPELTFSHHEAVAGLKIPGAEDEPDHDAMKHWLQHAVDLRLTRDELRAHIRASRSSLSRARGPEDGPPPVIEGKAAVIEPVPTTQLQVETLREVAVEIVAAERDEHGRICLGPNMLERLRVAIAGEAE